MEEQQLNEQEYNSTFTTYAQYLYFKEISPHPTHSTGEAIGGTTTGSHRTADNSPTAAELRLPTSIEPLHYDLTIKTYLPFYVDFPAKKNLTFDGRIEIKMKIIDSTRKIVLNAKNISDEEKIAIAKVKMVERLEKVEFVLASKIPKDSLAHLKIVYTGLISNTLGGLYQTIYTEADGKTRQSMQFNLTGLCYVRIAAVTHMEPSDARRLVPCFDEPAFKANWTVTRIGDWITSKFETTPRMSSYLLAILVSEFDYVEGHTKSGVRFRIWSRPEAKEMTIYAKDAAIKCLEFYEDYYDIKFPLRKQDMVALPDFSMGAMENWGLITYRENSLLYDDRYYAPRNKKRVAMVVAHELAHQWFGNLVTLKWWDDLWLNEGFAAMVEFLGVDEITNKNMRIKEYFLLYAVDVGLGADRVASSHPLSFRIDKASEVTEAFDSITYRKGASVLQMVSALIGEGNFKKAIIHYLKKFSYSNAKASDLWNSFDEIVTDVPGPRSSSLKVSDFADQWITQMGFPLVTVESFNATSAKITQSRYKTRKNAEDPPKYRNPRYGFQWDVPIWYQNSNDRKVKVAWLTRDEPLFIHVENTEEPLVVNADRRGFYQQNYDTNGWKKIIKQLKRDHSVYSPQTRNAIISDAFAAALIDKLDYTTLFELLEYARNETEYLPWMEIMAGFQSILEYFGNEPETKPAMSYMMSVLKPMYDNVNMKNLADRYKDEEVFVEMSLQQAVLSAFCSLGSKDCIEKFRALFDKEVSQKCGTGDKASKCVSVAAPLRQAMYCYGVKEGGEIAFKKVMRLYYAESVQLEKDYLLTAIGCSNDITSLKELLLLALDRNSSFARLQDVAGVFRAVSANPLGREFMFNFLVDRWEDIVNSFKAEHKAVYVAITECSRGIRTKQQLEQLRTLQKEGLLAEKYGAFDEAIENAEDRVEWIEKHFLHYELTIKTYLPFYVDFPANKNLTTDGHLEIHMKVISSTNTIVLNAKNITVLAEKIAAATHMEPSDARLMVPCFDEPVFKANWTVTVIHPKGTKAVSNGIENGEGERSGDWIISKFKTTPRMSSYLLAIFVSEFDYVEGHTSSGVRFRIWSRPEAKEMTAYAKDAAIKCLEFYENYYDIKFPLPKQENSLLYDPRYYGQQNKKRVAMVIAHELAHQWFGNLVTLKWWDDLWLNEGFASMVEFLGVDNITDKNMRIREYFLLYAIDEGLEADRVASSHPLSFKIDKAADVTEAFDDITYRKGASVLEMVSAVVGEENFKKAITHYLKKFSYANAQASDLWTSFDEIVTDVPGPRGSPLKVSDFADQWIVQMGFPLVTVESFNATSVKITQSRYKTNENAEELPKYRKPKYGFKWDPEEPFVVNADRHGFYRQNYDSSGWQKIIKQLKEDHEKLDYVTLFELLEYVKKETEYLPVEETMDGFRSILEYFGSEPESRAGMSYMRSILKPLYDKINMTYLANHYREDELFFEMNLEQAVLATYCKLGSRDCIEKFRTLFDKEVAQKCRTGEKASECVTVAAPLRQTMYCNGVKEGGEIAFEKKDYLLAALGCHNDITALKGLLLLALDRNSSFVRLQDVASVFRVVSSNPVGQEFMFNFLIERWEDILNGGIRTEQQIGQLRTLQKEGLHAKEYGAFNVQIEKAEYKVEWIKKHYRELADFFQKALPK
ncbi:unnamed protein product [Nippostrongylus brasiliensis]|uniref:Aminopeptidase N n=1 Tax=Nippostrongylus brasiliensis TaxID=27835 RepID=A0A158R084_NIPBR|nr:unnamed protein product [Nippostrongylus brasiliensis]